ncbi:MAG TPA: DUF1194 domain-containing protein [Rhizobiaceae bacterium]|nr:DUF1194 domain-containing protein [Rhizobiaceae bacterium]
MPNRFLDRILSLARPAMPAIAAFFFSIEAPAAQDSVDLELVLAVDVSRSMDFVEQQLQREGYSQAFRSPEVIEAITSGLTGRIAVTYMEWAGDTIQRVVVPWTIIHDAGTAAGFADALALQAPQRLSRTSISGAIMAAGALFGKSGATAMRKVIDVSGDGPNNQGMPVTLLRDEWVRQGVVINGLPLMIGTSSFGFGIDNLDAYYRDCVIGGPGSFVLSVYTWEEFPRAVRRKLVLEIAGIVPEPAESNLVQLAQSEAEVDCLVGERIWERRMRDLEWQ